MGRAFPDRYSRRTRQPGTTAAYGADRIAHADSSLRKGGYGGWAVFPAGSSDPVVIYYWPAASKHPKRLPGVPASYGLFPWAGARLHARRLNAQAAPSAVQQTGACE
jgi:hypothetical protein